MTIRTWQPALLLALSLASRLSAQTLGRIDFPNSGTRAAQAPFLRGMLLLHSFEYEDAAEAFRQAQAADSGFALAYWGEALTYTHPLWNQQDLARGKAVLERLGATRDARRARAGTAREAGYLDAAEALYFGEGNKARRDTLACQAFERLSRAYPEDDEARAFYALWLMGLSQAVRNIPTYMRAGAIAEDIYRRNPQHPGALHYIIHAFDDPIHAPLGLHAAREYSRIAADADHAQHMTTHIFLALGMWDEVISQNAIAAGDSTRWRPGHYTSWLGYGLLQEGRYDAARRQLELVRRNLPSPAPAAPAAYLMIMRAHYLVNTERWGDSLVRWPVDTAGVGPGPRAIDAFALGLAALRQGRRREAVSRLSRLEAIAGHSGDGAYASNPALASVLAGQLRALLEWDAGRKQEALKRLREIAGREDGFPLEYGPPDIVKPSHELLGELLLAMNRAGEAQREFQRALELAPGRSRSLLGLSRSAIAAGDADAAEQALARLAANWSGADPGLPELAEVRRMRAGR